VLKIYLQAKNSWRVVVAYKAGGLSDSEEDNKKIKQADKDTGIEMQQPRKGNVSERQAKLQFQSPPPNYPGYGPMWHQPGPPQLPLPLPMPQLPPPRQFTGNRPNGHALTVISLATIRQIAPDKGGHSILLTIMYMFMQCLK